MDFSPRGVSAPGYERARFRRGVGVAREGATYQ